MFALTVIAVQVASIMFPFSVLPCQLMPCHADVIGYPVVMDFRFHGNGRLTNSWNRCLLFRTARFFAC